MRQHPKIYIITGLSISLIFLSATLYITCTTPCNLRFLLLFSMLSISASLWWKKQARHYEIRNGRSTYYFCLNQAMFLLLATIGFYGLIICAHTKFPWLINTFSPEYIHSDGNINTSNKEKPVDLGAWAGLLALILTTVSAYYLVTLQGTTNQTKELLHKLEEREHELKAMKEDIERANHNADNVFMAMGEFVHVMVTIMATKPLTASEIEEFDYRARTLRVTLDLSREIADTHRYLPSGGALHRTIQCIEELHNIIIITKHAASCYPFIPTELLTQVSAYLEKNQTTTNAENINTAQTKINKMERQIRRVKDELPG